MIWGLSLDSESALATLIQSYGIGALKANTLLMTWTNQAVESDPRRLDRMNHILRGTYRLGCNLLMSNVHEAIEYKEDLGSKDRRIDIWWQDDATGRLSL